MVFGYRTGDFKMQANYVNEKQLKDMGGVEEFANIMGEAFKSMTKKGTTLDTAFAGDVVQVLKTPSGYQCVIETFRQYTNFDETQSSGCYYFVGTSPEGKAWRFFLIRAVEGEVEEAIPDISRDLKLPPIVTENVPLKEFMEIYRKTHRPVVK